MDKIMLEMYCDYLICSTSYTTATGLSRMTNDVISHDKITRFLSKTDFTSADLWEYAKLLVRKIENAEGVLIIDDSIAEKSYTDENALMAWHYDHAKGKMVKGINFISALYHTDAASIAIGCELIRKTEKVVNEKTGKIRRKSPICKQQFYRNLLVSAVTNKVAFKYVTNDVWFASAENMCFVKKELGKDFVMPLKANRKVALSEEKRAAGEFVRIKELEPGEGIMVWLTGVDFPLRFVRQLFKDGDGSTGVLNLASSDIELTHEQISKIYKKRWKIEEYHKSLKNNVSLAKSPTKTERTQANHLFTSICAFIKLESMSITTQLNHFALKGKIYFASLKAAFLELTKLRMKVFQMETGAMAPA